MKVLCDDCKVGVDGSEDIDRGSLGIWVEMKVLCDDSRVGVDGNEEIQRWGLGMWVAVEVLCDDSRVGAVLLSPGQGGREDELRGSFGI